MNTLTTGLLATVLVCAGACTPSSPRPDTDATPTSEAAFRMDPARLTVGSDTMDMTIVQGESRVPLGVAVSTVSRGTEQEREVITLVLEQRLRAGTMVDTLVVDATTLAPIRYRNEFGDLQSIAVDYGEDGHVVSRVAIQGAPSAIDTTLTAPYFDAAEFLPLVPTLPLAEGYSVSIPVFHYADGMGDVGIRVIGRDSTSARTADGPVWLVEFAPGPEQVSILSIEAATGRLLRMTAQVGPERVFESVVRAQSE